LLFELPDLEYFEPETVEEALKILQSLQTDAKILAGGTDLLGLLKDRVSGPQMPIPSALVNIKKIKDLRLIQHPERESVVGSAVTISEISSNAILWNRFPGFVQAASSVAVKQIRNMGTLGGNLCQRPWCWYFRHPAFNCYKKGGKQCYAITGDNSTYFSVYNLGICVMAHPSDTAPALISLGATAKIASPRDGIKEVKLSDFFLGPRSVQDNILKPDELLLSVSIPLLKETERSVYLKERIRNNWDFALSSVAASGSFGNDGKEVSSVRVVLGGVAPLPIVLKEVEKVVIGRKIDGEVRAEVGKVVSKLAHPLRMNKYKVRIVRALVLRALDSLFSTGSLQQTKT
jgi:xanthine dehydrogenase YagS FAD-binding subunit